MVASALPPCSSGATTRYTWPSSLSSRPRLTFPAHRARLRGSRSLSRTASQRCGATARSSSRSAVVPEAEGERWRVFLAIEISPAVRATLRGPLDGLALLSASIRVNQVERMHLTLHFLGQLPIPQVEDLSSRLVPIVERHHPIRLLARGVGAFPSLSRAQVLWAGITGSDLPRLIALQGDLGGGLLKAEVPVEDRPLARVARPLGAPERRRLQDWSTAWRDVDLGELPVNEVRLMRSQLGAGPPRYSTLATFPLK
ncbi:MAG: RNA 2',3'-cyclic phosphodiesterase [Chloroflexi bacterium]|nr:MAG: RNA 2',3'-cyclic phosphodiesterase [Chloroflexota bacterium]